MKNAIMGEMSNEASAQKPYPLNLSELRHLEYPSLSAGTDEIYLDHAGTTIPAKTLMQRFSAEVVSSIYGNPHSAAGPAQRTSRRIDKVRVKALKFFNADPAHFDLIFVPNATSGAKLVGDALRDNGQGFWYGYHKDSHTSLVGLREIASQGHRCFNDHSEVEQWLSEYPQALAPKSDASTVSLFSYPAQSNMDGSRLPLEWCARLRHGVRNSSGQTLTLLDAAGFASTSPIDLGDESRAPDFAVVSFYKIFGFPDLGALVVRKAVRNVFHARKYFGGGTVEVVSCQEEQWHISKQSALHESLEDGTLPFHSILALDHAIDVHHLLYGSMMSISRHVTQLATLAYSKLKELRHANGEYVCKIYKSSFSEYSESETQGPIVCFNLRGSHGAWVSNTEIEKLANIKNIALRSGGLCNPGGTASHLDLSPWQLRENFSYGHRCGNEVDIVNGKPTGALRISFGAMSNTADLDKFVAFIQEFFQDKHDVVHSTPSHAFEKPLYKVERLAVYPIKSCGGWSVPHRTPWTIRREGLQWDREWALVHLGTNRALSQKQYPKMALIKPSIDLAAGVLRIRLGGSLQTSTRMTELTIPLSADPKLVTKYVSDEDDAGPSEVCGELVQMQVYKDSQIEYYFTSALDVPCTLVRYPVTGDGKASRQSKARLQPHQYQNFNKPVSGELTNVAPSYPARPILLSNESPILMISRSSLNRLNEQIKATGGKAAEPEVFRANIIISEDHDHPPGNEQPYVEDSWRYLQIGQQFFQALGACRRCQMVCVDQQTAMKDREPFLTLAKTRRFGGKVYFGQHTCHLAPARQDTPEAQHPVIRVGDSVRPFAEGDELGSELLELLEGK